MKKVICSDSSQIVGDEVAVVMLEYAAALASHQASEPLTFRAVGTSGGIGRVLPPGPRQSGRVEEADDGDEPDNTVAIAFMRGRIAELGARGTARPQSAVEQRTASVLDGYEFWEHRAPCRGEGRARSARLRLGCDPYRPTTRRCSPPGHLDVAGCRDTSER